MSPHIRIQFGTPSHGWLPVTIETPTDHLRFVASHIPEDSLLNLIDALHVVLATDGAASVTWDTEPTEYAWIFAAAGEVAALTIRAFPDHRRTAHEEHTMLTIQADRQVLVRSFWRALRSLETQDHFAQQWQRPFPHDALAQLSATLSTSRAA
ncbi:MAG: hypothetical protein M3R24_12995 [Chloroflexota bacterium]|nr:hypothetical protein [Chloroflexota bacterium]